jgi:hypothetical protein
MLSHYDKGRLRAAFSCIKKAYSVLLSWHYILTL